MIPAAFDYHRADTLDEALKLLKKHGDDAKVLSGGMSLLPMLKLRLASFAHLVDINRVPGLDYIKEEKGTLRIGAMTRQAALERSDVIKSKYPILADAVPLIADPLVRNRGTIGGNVANGDPGNDQPAIMIALGATFIVRGAKERSVAANQFYKGLYDTALARSEILTEIRIPVPPLKSGGAYTKLKRKTGDFAVAAAAVQLTLGKYGAVERAGIALTNAGLTPIEAVDAAKYLVGKMPDEKTIAEAAKMAAAKSAPSADRRGSVEYKKEMARVLTARALHKAVQRAGGS
ncbi:MAG: xanthine dehydrogenase family protein subunit M [Betaproteobacteria bacterium]|nr:MAG: xanthine dehydrogenase family protein subunit M [Betaproteobacteria bacterium]